MDNARINYFSYYGGNLYKTIRYELKDKVARVTFDRPEVRNAFNWDMIQELFHVFRRIKEDESIRVVILTGEGSCFCAGADLHWMGGVMDMPFEDNYREALELADLFYLIYSLPKPVLGRINGPAIGGGTGFVSICDISIASTEAKFSFSEVRLGLIPADISPFIFRKCGENLIRPYFLTGKRLDASLAFKVGLVNAVAEPDELDRVVDEYVQQLLAGGPNAIKACKELLEKVPLMTFEGAREYTARVLAELRKSQETQEGIAAFLKKRKPNWVE
ncbi:enoyl-CoA hydratase/isomerase family protein [bacterium]|nr:enoyl-CoA hydratase/isomerase family protein [bacterium]